MTVGVNVLPFLLVILNSVIGLEYGSAGTMVDSLRTEVLVLHLTWFLCSILMSYPG